MWGKYQLEMRGNSPDNAMHQYIERPSHYNLRDTDYDTTLSSSSKFHPGDFISDGSEDVKFDVDQSDSAQNPVSPDLFRARSANNDFIELELSPQRQLNAIANQVTSHDKLDIVMSSVASGTQKSYQSSWKMRSQFRWCRRSSPWLQTDSI